MTYECSCDEGDPPTVQQIRHVKRAKKRYRCDECGAWIKRGQPYEYMFGIWEGDAITHRTCARCEALERWATISAPCFCFTYTNLHRYVAEMVTAVRKDVPEIIREWRKRRRAIVDAGGKMRGVPA